MERKQFLFLKIYNRFFFEFFYLATRNFVKQECEKKYIPAFFNTLSRSNLYCLIILTH